MRRKALALFVASLAVLTLSACDAVPDSGPVREGLSNLAQAERGVFINPQGPTPDADPESIVRGFVRASASNLNDYEIARQFLAPTLANKWDPGVGALVYDGAPGYENLSGGAGMLTLQLAAAVDQGGTLRLARPDESAEVRFELTRVGSQWRIASAPNGIVIDRSNFSSVWETRALYFTSPDRRLVAELRWMITDRSLLPSQMVTQIVRALIRGPSAGMNEAISTAFPAGTTLSSEAVPLVDGVAVIDVSSEILDGDEITMSAVKRQLAASLQGLPGVARFQLVVNGDVVGGGDATVSEETSSGGSQRIVLMKEGEFGAAVGNSVHEIAGVSDEVAQLKPTAVSVTADLSAAVALHANGVSWVTDGQSRVVDGRQDLLAPSIDQLGYVWTYSGAEPGKVVASKPGARVFGLLLGGFDDATVEAIRVSPGGSRIAVLANADGTSEVRVLGIVRDESGAPVSLGEAVALQLSDPGAPIDLDWIGDNRFVLLSEAGLLGGSAKATIVEVSGRFPVSAGSVTDGVAISGGSGSSLMRVLDDQHRLFKPQGSGWQQLMAGVDLIAKVG